MPVKSMSDNGDKHINIGCVGAQHANEVVTTEGDVGYLTVTQVGRTKLVLCGEDGLFMEPLVTPSDADSADQGGPLTGLPKCRVALAEILVPTYS